MSFIEVFLLLCPLFGVSFIGGSTVLWQRKHVIHWSTIMFLLETSSYVLVGNKDVGMGL